MRRRGGTARVAVRADAAGRELEVPDLRGGLETDASARSDHAPCEVALEAVSGVDVPLVEAADRKRPPAHDREVPGHHVLHVHCDVVAERKLEVAQRPAMEA